MMKNLLIYYIAILVPLFLIILYLAGPHESLTFVALLCCYVIYRGFTDGKRLSDKGIVSGRDRWKVYIPFYINHLKHFKELYL
jgi:hypothetical protein